MSKLMWVFILPFLSSFMMFFVPRLSGKTLQRFALVLSLIPLALLLSNYSNWIGSLVQLSWIPALGIDFHLRVDALSLVFLFIVAIITPISILATNEGDFHHPHLFYGLVFLLQALLIGFFTAADLALFTIFWESILLPLYFMINLWGGPKRRAAALKFIVYMIAGSTLMVAVVLALYFISGETNGSYTFNMDALSQVAETTHYAPVLLVIFLLAFAVKTPLFPFHAWLPDTYYQASTAGSILLAGILSKAGIYGFFRIGLGFFPHLIQAWNPILLGLAIAGVLYGGMAAWMQNNFKRLIAYSSFSHVNFVLAGIFVWNQVSQSGAVLQAFNHSITITGLFLVSGWLQDRLGSSMIGSTSGMAKFLPHLCWLTLFFVLSSVALPGLNNFIGEVMILFGVFGQSSWLAFLLGLTVILSVVYMLRWMQKVYFEEPSFFQDRWIDINKKEWLIALPLIGLILWIGIYPAPLLKQIIPIPEEIAKTEKMP